MIKKIILILLLCICACATEKPVEQKKRLWRDEDYLGKWYFEERDQRFLKDRRPDFYVTKTPEGFEIEVENYLRYVCKFDAIRFKDIKPGVTYYESLILDCEKFILDGPFKGNMYVALSIDRSPISHRLDIVLSTAKDKNCFYGGKCYSVHDVYTKPKE